MPLASSRPLLDVLGARWKVGAPVTAVAWDDAGALVGFGFGDGSLGMAPPAWEGGPTVRKRATGGAELVAPTAPAPALARVAVHEGACLSVAADPAGGFLSGGADGQLARVQPDGVIDTLARCAGARAAPVASGAGGWRAFAAGRAVMRLGAGSRQIEVPDAPAALAVAPDGSRLAIAHAGGVMLWAGGETPRVLAAQGAHVALAWSPDAKRLAAATGEGDLRVWRLPEGEARVVATGAPAAYSLGFTADGAVLVASGATRVTGWLVADDTTHPEPLSCGIGSREPVSCVACHPSRPLIAAGFRHGAVLLCQPRAGDVLFVRGPGDGAVSALAWSRDGAALAIGTDCGEAALVTLPELLFRGDGEGAP